MTPTCTREWLAFIECMYHLHRLSRGANFLITHIIHWHKYPQIMNYDLVPSRSEEVALISYFRPPSYPVPMYLTLWGSTLPDILSNIHIHQLTQINNNVIKWSLHEISIKSVCYIWRYQSSLFVTFEDINQVCLIHLKISIKSVCYIWRYQSSLFVTFEDINQVCLIHLKISIKSVCYIWRYQSSLFVTFEDINQVCLLHLKISIKSVCYIWRYQSSLFVTFNIALLF